MSEWIELADGRRITLHDERGFTTSAFGPEWQHETPARLVASVLTTVLPDDAEASGEDHPWDWLAELARQKGIGVTTAELRLVPYVVELGPRVLARLPEAE